MGWDMHEVSWKGFEFEVESVADEWSRRLVQYSYPGRPGANFDDLDREPLKITLVAVFSGTTYRADLKILQDLYQEGTAGSLVHPIFGTLQARCARMREHFDHTRENFASAELEFLEDQLDMAAFQETTGTTATAANWARAAASVATSAVNAL